MASQALSQRNVGPIRAMLAFAVLGVGIALLLAAPLQYRPDLLILCPIFLGLAGSFAELLFPIISRSTPPPEFGSRGLQRTLRVLLALVAIGFSGPFLALLWNEAEVSITLMIGGIGLLLVTTAVGGVLGIVLDCRRRIGAQQRRIVTNECTRGGDRVLDDR